MAIGSTNCFSRQVFILASQRVTQKQLEQAEPHKPACQASDFAADKLRVLEALEEAGAADLTTRELMDRGGGMRPQDGIAIKTVSEGRGIYRYILCKFPREEKAKATAWKNLQRDPVKTDNFGRALEPDRLLLFRGLCR